MGTPQKKKSDRLTPRPVTVKGEKYWQVQLGSEVRDGKRIRLRRTFRNREEAETFAQLKRIERRNHGTAGISLSERLRADAIEAGRLLAPYGVSLVDLAREHIKRQEQIEKSETIGNAVAAFLSARQADGASRHYLRDLHSRLGRFVATFGTRKLAEVTAREIAEWLRALGQSPLSRNTFHLRISALFSFARQCHWVPLNPMTDVPRAKVVTSVPGILTPEQTARLLESANEITLPFFAIGAFGGLRSAELERLEWRNVDFEAGLIEVPACSSKTASRRFVSIRSNLMEWLMPYRNRHGLVCGDIPNLSKRLSEDRARAGINDWPSNALRHSFASYHLAHFRDPKELALELGHIRSEVTFAHYRELVRPSEAERFWRIVPAIVSEALIRLAG
jgi:integrase